MNNQELAEACIWKAGMKHIPIEKRIADLVALLNKERPFETGERIQNDMMVEPKEQLKAAEGFEELKRKKINVLEIENAKLKNELENVAETLDKDAYPLDIFPNISSDEISKINALLKKEMGFPIDRLSAYIMRFAVKNNQNLAKQIREKTR
jgi:ACT domain-containing protein